jgi:hypothetical protein
MGTGWNDRQPAWGKGRAAVIPETRSQDLKAGTGQFAPHYKPGSAGFLKTGSQTQRWCGGDATMTGPNEANGMQVNQCETLARREATAKDHLQGPSTDRERESDEDHRSGIR